MHVSGVGQIPAHRFSYQMNIGPIPEAMFICHDCDNPGCVNPAHLYCGTRSENQRDCNARGRHRLRVLGIGRLFELYGGPHEFVRENHHDNYRDDWLLSALVLGTVSVSRRRQIAEYGIETETVLPHLSTHFISHWEAAKNLQRRALEEITAELASAVA